MTDVLILGGTGWLSSRICEAWLDAGASVTCLARGGRPVPYGASLVAADRDAPGAYAAVAAREWDEVVDVSSRPAHVAAAAEALAPVARHATYVSSVSVYARDDEPGADERAEILAPATGDADDYGRQKSAAEAAVRRAFARRAAIVRPGLIVGPGDPTDRFGFWPARFALAGEESVLVPDAPEAHAQVVDVEDLASFIARLGDARFVGAVNAVGDPIPLEGLLRRIGAVAGHTGAVVAAPPSFLEAHGVGYWAGPRSLPLWLPADAAGFATRSNTAYRLLGGALRPLEETIARVLEDERARGLDRPRAAGLTREEEREILAALVG
ncbi:NAD-dependent epimerase/dehydratase family protein [Microbacterium flavum]|uniref:NAD-dependent epimerase/dehydratase family protein n=1 Tax=Microbacterium flavum TaxID=415216 RepID=A0ABS5XQZ9_9MICO|nr:NAD-dependent epimerase/dehydratase family protein [Microbacterium flavum]MBT8796954.1 NAD-dependent epimerase/dehydratase family protein [Microbacterium flavum]